MTPLQQQRLTVDKTRQAVAEEVGTTVASYARWEIGDSAPRPGKYRKLAKALHVEPSQVVALVAATRRLAKQ